MARPWPRLPTTSKAIRDGISYITSARYSRCARRSRYFGRAGSLLTPVSSSRSAPSPADVDRFVFSFSEGGISMHMKIAASVAMCALATMALVPSTHHSAGGTVAGKVTYTGTAPKMKQIDMAKEPSCAKQHATPVMNESVVAGEGNTLGDVVVYISAGGAPSARATHSDDVRQAGVHSREVQRSSVDARLLRGPQHVALDGER